jgi:hypothetical protein
MTSAHARSMSLGLVTAALCHCLGAEMASAQPVREPTSRMTVEIVTLIRAPEDGGRCIARARVVTVDHGPLAPGAEVTVDLPCASGDGPRFRCGPRHAVSALVAGYRVTSAFYDVRGTQVSAIPGVPGGAARGC